MSDKVQITSISREAQDQLGARKADIWDTLTSATVVYEGFKLEDGTYLIRKMDLTAETRTTATGVWSDRTTLIYT